MPCYDTVDSRAMSLHRKSHSGSRPIPRRRCLTSRVRPWLIALGASDVVPNATTTNVASTGVPTSTVDAPTNGAVTPIYIAQDLEGVPSEEPDATATATVTTTGDASLPEETPVEDPAVAAPLVWCRLLSRRAIQSGGHLYLGFVHLVLL